MAVKKKAESAKSIPTKLYRSETDKVLGGVAGGLADYFQVDPTLLRIGFVLLTIFGGSGILFYIVLWLLMPSEGMTANFSEETIRDNVEDIKERAERFGNDFQKEGTRQNSRYIFGVIIVAVGVMFLLQNFNIFPWFDLGKLWPLILVFLGYSMLTKKK